MKQIRFSILLAVFLVLSLFLSTPLSVLVVKNQNSGKAVYLSDIRYGESFAVEWMHSVELQPWQEVFQYTPQGIILRETRFKSFGAGVPAYGGKEYRLEDGFIVFKGLDIKMENIPYGVSSFAKHKLIFRQVSIPLYALVDDGTFVCIRVEKKPLYDYFYKKVMLWLQN